MKATMRHRGSNVGFLRILTSNRLIRNGRSSRWPWKVILMVAEVGRPIALRVETRSALEPVPGTSSLANSTRRAHAHRGVDDVQRVREAEGCSRSASGARHDSKRRVVVGARTVRHESAIQRTILSRFQRRESSRRKIRRTVKAEAGPVYRMDLLLVLVLPPRASVAPMFRPVRYRDAT